LALERSTTLHCTKGGSDKIYVVQLVSVDGGYKVNGRYGRRVPGTACDTRGEQVCTKTDTPVPFNRAQCIYDEFVEMLRRKKGYEHVAGASADEVEISTAAARTAERTASPHDPMLLTSIDEERLYKLARNPAWCFQRKFDGERRLIEADKALNKADAINRKGEYIGDAEPRIKDAAFAIGRAFVNDGEQIGGTQFAFDLLMLDGEDWRQRPMMERWKKLADIAPMSEESGILVVETAFTRQAKEAMIVRARAERWEGIVAKMVSAPYEAGRSQVALKFKFKDSKTCLVLKQNMDKHGVPKRSVELGLLKDGEIVSVGNVTILSNFEVPADGTFVEVEYLYAYPNGGSLYQTVYKGPRPVVAVSLKIEIHMGVMLYARS
jgi:bifunctional non-homologous end joining protein LigD